MKAIAELFLAREATRSYLTQQAESNPLVKAKTKACRIFDVTDSAIERVVADTEAGSFSSYVRFTFTRSELGKFRHFTIIPGAFLRLKPEDAHGSISISFDDDPWSFLRKDLTLKVHEKQRREITGMVNGLLEIAAPFHLRRKYSLACRK